MTAILPPMFVVLREAINAQYQNIMPQGFEVWQIAEYDPKFHTAPGLAFDKRDNPDARYLVILGSENESVPALGVTVNDALAAAILKIENRKGARQ